MLRKESMFKTITFLLAGLTFMGGYTAQAAEAPGSAAENPADFLEFISELDNECQKRSPGGRLRLVRNLHPEKPIKFRFVRVFSKVKQPGFARGTLQPGEEPTQLGCTKISGRDQNWEIVKVEFL